MISSQSSVVSGQLQAAGRALVVEDERGWQQILAELLSDAGLVVDVAESYATAVTLLAAAPHQVAVIDLSLGGSDHHNQDGLMVLDAVRRQDPTCTPLLLTGFATVEIAVSAMKEYGAHTCLRKEVFRRAEFRALIREILAGAALVRGQNERQKVLDPAPGLKPATAGVQPQTGDGDAQALVVEDDAGWASIFSELLADLHLPAVLCRSYGEALGHLKRGRFTIAVVDLALASSRAPGQSADGLRLLEQCRQADVPALVVSGIATPADAERALHSYGAFGFLEKQAFDRGAFVGIIRQALEAQAHRPPSGASGAELGDLTEREREVLELLAQGLTNKQIAARLVISPNTVKRHLKSIFARLEVNTRAAAVAKAMGTGRRSPEP